MYYTLFKSKTQIIELIIEIRIFRADKTFASSCVIKFLSLNLGFGKMCKYHFHF